MKRARTLVGMVVVISVVMSACDSGSTSTITVQPNAEMLGLDPDEVPLLECLDGQHTAALVGAPPLPDVPGVDSKEEAVADLARLFGIEGTPVEFGAHAWGIQSAGGRTVLVTKVDPQGAGWVALSAEYCSDE